MIAFRRPLRICIAQGAFLPVPPRLGGAVEKAWFALGREFARHGHEVTHIGRSFPGLPDAEEDAGVRYRRVRGHATPASLWRLKLLDLAYSLRVRRALPRADILVTNTFWLPLLERRPDRGRIFVHVARFPKGQLRLYPRTVVLQTVSTPIRDAIARELGRADDDRIRVVPYPLSPNYLVAPAAEPAHEILYAGRLHPEKGVHLLIAAFLRLQAAGSSGDWTLRIIGPWRESEGGGGARYRAELLRLARSAGAAIAIGEAVFDESQLVAHYRRAAIFAYPSLAEHGETFGLSVLEAMAAGCAPVVSDLACFRDFIVPHDNGLVFAHRAPDPAAALADTLTQLIADDARRRRLRESAWHAARSYALEDVAQSFLGEFHAAVRGRSSSLAPVFSET